MHKRKRNIKCLLDLSDSHIFSPFYTAALDQDSLVNLEEFLLRRSDGNLSMDLHDSPHQQGLIHSPEHLLGNEHFLEHPDSSSPTGSSPYFDFLHGAHGGHHSHNSSQASLLQHNMDPMPTFGGTPSPTQDDDDDEEERDSKTVKKRKSAQGRESLFAGAQATLENFSGARPRIGWTVNDRETWHRMFDPQMNEM